ncbi:hypothetical protein GCM10011339_44130 [Echinicola rosea]|uniref:Uncharacterized protein n=1 Tax=Echinicola rosea TaxID=1807691 RepID=A0ABQ1VBC7_9BACT|nr:hypothetical protein GCM10011339_44130 [Echinicola rosea]
MKELDHKIISSEIKLDGSLINSTIYKNSIDFILNSESMEIGEHRIDMVLHVDTESGSLANVAGAEFYVIKQSFKVIIDPTPPEFDSYRGGFENGYLTYRWNGPDSQSNFIYEILRHGLRDTLIYDPQANHFIDYGYVGGAQSNMIRAKGFDFKEVIGSDEVYQIPADFKLTKDAEGMVRLVWSNSVINTEKVQMSIMEYSLFDSPKPYPYSSSGEILIGKPGFMQELHVIISLYRTGYLSQKASISVDLKPTPNLKPFIAYAMLKERNKLLITSNETMYRYDLEGFVLEDSLSLNDQGLNKNLSLTVSPDESKVFISDDYGHLISFNPIDFNVTHHKIEPTIEKFTDQNSLLTTVKLGNVTDNGLLAMKFWKGDHYAMVLDTNGGEVLWHSPPSNHYAPTVSNDGEYIAVDLGVPYANYEGWILKLKDGHYHPMGKIDGGDHAFLPGGKEVMSITRQSELTHYTDGDYIRVYNLMSPPQDTNSTFNRLRDFSIPYKSGLNKMDYDPITNLIGFTYSDNIDLFDLNTMQFEQSFSGPLLQYSNGHLLNKAGFIKTAP